MKLGKLDIQYYDGSYIVTRTRLQYIFSNQALLNEHIILSLKDVEQINRYVATVEEQEAK